MYQSPNARYRNVTTWARSQADQGPNSVAVRPLVMPFSTAQATGAVPPEKRPGLYSYVSSANAAVSRRPVGVEPKRLP